MRYSFLKIFGLIGLLFYCSVDLASGKIRYGRQIRPILSDKCFFCHGTDSKTREGDLRLDIREDALKEKAFIPGEPEKSTLIQLINATDEDEMMPPPKSHKKLDASEKQLLYDWIQEGAKYEPHWAYSPPKREDGEGIDSLVAKSLAAQDLSPAGPAPAHILVRRLHFDLTGLPPKEEEVAAFLKRHAEDPDAATRETVDRLLALPHYGERMAFQWLDLVRYADTVGYHGDVPRDASPFRDYVIEAFNSDLPYNQFIVEQVAGDLLPNATLSQKVAASYSRLNQVSQEGGIQDAEYLAKYQAERVRTTSAAFLGSTLACAECHDHKFDPFTTRDFYSLAAYFSDILEKGAYTGNGSFQEDIEPYKKKGIEFGPWGPILRVPTAAQEKALAELDSRIKEQEAALAGPIPNFEPLFIQWLASERAKNTGLDPKPRDLPLVDETLPVQPKIDKATLVTKDKAPVQSGTHSRRQSSKELIQHIATLAAPRKIHTGDTFYAWVHLDPKNPPKALMLQFNSNEKWEHRVYWGSDAIEYGRTQKGTTAYHHGGPLPETGKWVRLEIPSAAVGLKPGQSVAQTSYSQFGGTVHWDGAGVTTSDLSARFAHLPQNITELVTAPADKMTPAQIKTLQDHYRSIDPATLAIRQTIASSKDERAKLLKSSPTVLATVSGKRRPVRILPRGDWTDKTGPVVEAAPPAFLSKGEKIGTTRLDLARWIASEKNPLTARVMVNRVWARIFGTGLSSNPGDFGYQGEFPSHPELLDWLALEFIKNNWSVKHLVRTILLSKTYRQTSTPGSELIMRDPHNRLLARQTQLRLPAELIRDNALSLAGLLDLSVGGPSAKPYQPKGYYRHLNFPGRTYQASAGSQQYRRGLYTHWQRTFLHPMMKNFDAPAREECTTARPHSNTPLQALTLLNDPSFTEAARVLATRLLENGDQDLLSRAFHRCLSRDPDPAEKAILENLHQKELERFKADPELAKKFISVGQSKPPANLDPARLAAATSITRAILNLHETITRY